MFSRFSITYTDDHPEVIGIPHTQDWQTRRLEAIDDGKHPTDPWNRPSNSFGLSGRALMEKALKSPPREPRPTASDFAAWIYSLYLGEPTPLVLKEAKEAEDEILHARQDWTSYAEFRHFRLSNWQQIHCGLGAPGPDDVQNQFEIPSLRLNGEPLRAIPDLVFRQQDTGKVVIIEVKFSMAKIPRLLWANVWAQLWVYSKIPEFATAPIVSCVGEVWGTNTGGWSLDGLDSSVYLRSSVQRDPRGRAFDQYFGRMFEIYGGTLEPGWRPEVIL